jgi:hypothetical protein
MEEQKAFRNMMPAAQTEPAARPAAPVGREAYGAPLSKREQRNPVPPPKVIPTSATMPAFDSSRRNPDPLRDNPSETPNPNADPMNAAMPNSFVGNRALGVDGKAVNTDQEALDKELVRARNAVPKASLPTAVPPVQEPQPPAVAQPAPVPAAPPQPPAVAQPAPATAAVLTPAKPNASAPPATPRPVETNPALQPSGQGPMVYGGAPISSANPAPPSGPGTGWLSPGKINQDHQIAKASIPSAPANPSTPFLPSASSKIMALAAPPSQSSKIMALAAPPVASAQGQPAPTTNPTELANAPTSLPGMPPPGPMPGSAPADTTQTVQQPTTPPIKPGQSIQAKKPALGGVRPVTSTLRKPAPGYQKLRTGLNGLPLGQPGTHPLFKTSVENISHEAFTEGVSRELHDYMDKQAAFQKEAELEYLMVLRSDLTKMAIDLGEDCPYSSEDIYRFTESAESFNKAASMEAHMVWAGLSDELVKAGADQDFLDGMIKEAAPWGAMLRNPGAALSAAAKAFGGGGAKATEEVMNLAKKAPGLGGITTNTGELLTNAATMPEHLSGARRFKFTNELENILGSKGAISPAAQESLDAAKTQYMGKLKDQLGTNAEDAFQTHMHDIYRKAKVAPGATATADQLTHQGYIDQMAGGDFSHIAGPGRLNVHPDVLNSKLNPDVLNDAKTWASQASGAKHDYTGVTPYSQYMNDSARNLTPPGGGKDPSFMGVKFRPVTSFNRAMTGGAAGTLLGMPFGVAPITGAIGTGLGAATGLFGTAPVVAAGALGTAGLAGTAGYLGYKGVKGVANNLGLGGQDTQTRDQSGELQDRHRVVPFMNNRATGAIGGALLAALIANHSGMNGPMSWLLPILGGVAGYHYLPQMMNKWKDPYGVGENAINPLAAGINQQYPPGQ